MPLSDLPIRVLFRFFLITFLLIGIFPAWQRTVLRIRRQREKIRLKAEADAASATQGSAILTSAQRQGSQQLNDFEIFILQQLAQAGIKGLSRKQIKDGLHLESSMARTALHSLQRKGLIRPPLAHLPGSGYRLSSKGRDYAVQAGFSPAIHKPDAGNKLTRFLRRYLPSE